MTTKKKIKFPTVKQLQKALPAVSAGLSILSSMPFNRKVTRTLAVAAAATGAVPATGRRAQEALRAQLLEALDQLAALEKNPEATPTRIAELTARALTLARVLVTDEP